MKFSFLPALLFSVFSFLMLGCSSNAVIVQKKANVDFSLINTYSLFPLDSTFTEQQNISHRLRNSIEIAIEKEFDAQGFNYKVPEEADVMVAYLLTGIEIVKPFTTSNQLNTCVHCDKDQDRERNRSRGAKSRSPDANQQQMKTRKLAKEDNERNIGAIVLNIIDRKTLRTLWQSEAELNVKSSDNNIDVQNKIRFAVSEIMKLYPSNVTSES
ncbi:MAG: DUF4136 domain-containing protein [Thalassotalea sp.]